MYGKGLFIGLGITLKEFFKKKVTEQYPEQRARLQPRFHGSFKLEVSKCIACGICSINCPNKVIKVETAKTEDNLKRLTGYEMNIAYCLFCGLCVESCPTKALKFNHEFELACYHREAMILKLANASDLAQTQAAAGMEG